MFVDDLIAFMIPLHAKGRGRYFASLVRDLAYDKDTGWGVVGLDPVFSAMQRGDW
jgi:hypothetical protein